MKTMTIKVDYPDSLPAVANMSHETFEQDARLAMAMKLYEIGRLSSGQASNLAEIPRTDFLLRCHEYGVDSVAWDTDELKRELQ